MFMETISEKNSIKGYKVFGDDWYCNDKLYCVGKVYHEDTNISAKTPGMHFCTKLADCFSYYDFRNVRVAEVEGWGAIARSGYNSAIAVSDLKIVRELIFPKSGELVKALDDHYHISDRINRGVIKEENMLRAVKHHGYNIVYFSNPSEEIQLAAVKQNLDAINYIDNPTKKVKDYISGNTNY
ncbi:hypothetical protein SAC12B_0116 [Lactobacillus phage SAC12B]|uniref:DUF7666 domain-containing protein n=1 Tax=Lactobacillus phage SAC12B TaxID=2510941 RepID=A0A4Y5FFQ0_9CAUD|nr:hypothetical protein HWC10_gp185 [Lactobacillus phage SAC12B]QBJ03905.1 hypothetical protein SAC12B_0116 [Lactobacillus phage SAC12B]